MVSVFTVSLLSVLRIFLVCAAGTVLARCGLATADFRRSLSRVILYLMLPCFLVSRLSASADAENLVRWVMLPCVALVYVAFGLALGRLAVAVLRPPPELRRVVTAALGFGNSGYIPFPLVLAIAATSPLFADDPGAGSRGVAYISVYLIGMSPCLWGLGYPYLAHKPWRELRLSQVLSPPVLSVFCGICFGISGPLNRLFVAADAPLRVVMDSAELIGQGAIPCALLILGANLTPPQAARPTHIGIAPIAAVAVGRLLVLPTFGCLLALGLLRLGVIPNDPMFLLVLMIEAAVPSATNLIVMCQVHDRGERAMSGLLVATYVLAVPALTGVVAVFLWVIGNFHG